MILFPAFGPGGSVVLKVDRKFRDLEAFVSAELFNLGLGTAGPF